MTVSRRGFLIGMPLFLAGCTSTAVNQQGSYAALPAEKFPLKEVPVEKIKPELRRTQVAYSTAHKPGTIVVDTPARRLYYVLENGQAMRYGVGVGRQGLAFAGNAYVGRKAEWPTWTPTENMQRREARYRKLAGGMPGGPNNPWVLAPCISSVMVATRISVSMVPTSRNRSAMPCRAAASA